MSDFADVSLTCEHCNQLTGIVEPIKVEFEYAEGERQLGKRGVRISGISEIVQFACQSCGVLLVFTRTK